MRRLTIRALTLALALILALGAVAALAEARNGSVTINAKNFPDARFRAIVKSRYDKDRDGKLSSKELSKVKEMYVGAKGIESLKGIERFTSLEQLSCRHNRIEKLDLTGNSKLWALDCDGNQMTSLKLGRKSRLEILNCYGNALEKLDIGGCPILREMAQNELIYASQKRVGYGTGKDVLFNADITTTLTNGHRTVRKYMMPSAVKFSSKAITIREGKSATLDLRGAYVVMEPATAVYPFSITNGNNSVLEMEHRGFYYIKGLKKGRSTVTVTCGNRRGSVSVTVE